jgi:uncharacterized protein YdhG (YjbR/CyaY superfamily)
VSAQDVDEYLRGVEEPKRSTLEALRRTILEIVPDAEQVISYKVPAFRVEGRIVAGFAAFKDHVSYLPFSGAVLPALASEYVAEWQPSVRRDHVQVQPGVRLASSIHRCSSGRRASSSVVTLMYRVRSVVPSGGGESKSAPPRKTTFTEMS